MYESAAAGFPDRGTMTRFAAACGFPITRSEIVSILFVLVVNLSSPFSPSKLPEGILGLPTYAHNAPSQVPAYRTGTTVAVALECVVK